MISTIKNRNFLYSNFSEIKSIKKIKKGIANNVYLIKTKTNKKYILKDYKHKYNDYCKELIINNCIKNNIKIPNLIKKFQDKNNKIEIYEYIKHNNYLKINNKRLKLLIQIVQNIDLKIINYKDKDTIFYKVNYYKTELEKIKNYKFNKEKINFLLKQYSKININNFFNDLYIIHGDISLSNVLWHKNYPIIIDFDEAIIAPREYEYASMIIKLCFKNGKFNIKLAKKIIKNLSNINISKLKELFDFYILKVLLEKIYLYENKIIDLNDKNQKKDYWLDWYNLFINSQIKISLFNCNK